jgi:hypothetical protein
MKDDEFNLLRPAVLLVSAAMFASVVVHAFREAAGQRAKLRETILRSQTAPTITASGTQNCEKASASCPKEPPAGAAGHP